MYSPSAFDEILRVEPAVRIERGRRVQIAEHRTRRSDPEHAVDDLVLEAGIAELEPHRAGVARSGRQDAELRQPVGLLEPHPRQGFADSRKRAGGHRLRAVGDDLERGEIMTPDGVGDQQDPQERRRRRQQLDPMRFNRGAYCVRTAVMRRNDGPAVAEPVQQRVDAADMVEQQEDQRAIGRPRHLELRQQPIEIEHRSLALAGRARAEQNQAGCRRAPRVAATADGSPARSKLVRCHESSLSNRTANWTCASSISRFQRGAVADANGMMMLRFCRAARSNAHSFGE